MSRDSLSSNSAFSSRVPSIIAFSEHPGSIHLNLSNSEQDILENYFKHQRKESTLSKSNSSTLSLPRKASVQAQLTPKKNRFALNLKENLKKVSFKFK